MTWTTAPTPVKKQKLIRAKKIKKSPVSLGPDGRARLVNSMRINRHAEDLDPGVLHSREVHGSR